MPGYSASRSAADLFSLEKAPVSLEGQFDPLLAASNQDLEPRRSVLSGLHDTFDPLDTSATVRRTSERPGHLRRKILLSDPIFLDEDTPLGRDADIGGAASRSEAHFVRH